MKVVYWADVTVIRAEVCKERARLLFKTWVKYPNIFEKDCKHKPVDQLRLNLLLGMSNPSSSSQLFSGESWWVAMITCLLGVKVLSLNHHISSVWVNEVLPPSEKSANLLHFSDFLVLTFSNCCKCFHHSPAHFRPLRVAQENVKIRKYQV